MFPLLNARQKKILEEEGGVDFAHIVFDDGLETRFRVNLFRQRGRLSLVARRVNNSIPNFEGLGLPPVLAEIASHDQGIVILAGVTGSGKSTTIASMLQYVNDRERMHIVTIEDPIEFTFNDDKSIINQREVGIDVIDWDTALKHAVRQDPDIILVGEMRDRDTFNAAMHAAETGHLVFGTIHASTAPSTISRILDLFPRDMHSPLRQSMAFNLKAVIAQKLLPTTKEMGRQAGMTRDADRRDHADEPDGPQADPQRGGQQARRRDPDRQGRGDAWTSPRASGSSSRPRRSSGPPPSRSPPAPSSLKMALKGIYDRPAGYPLTTSGTSTGPAPGRGCRSRSSIGDAPTATPPPIASRSPTMIRPRLCPGDVRPGVPRPRRRGRGRRAAGGPARAVGDDQRPARAGPLPEPVQVRPGRPHLPALGQDHRLGRRRHQGAEQRPVRDVELARLLLRRPRLPARLADPGLPDRPAAAAGRLPPPTADLRTYTPEPDGARRPEGAHALPLRRGAQRPASRWRRIFNKEAGESDYRTGPPITFVGKSAGGKARPRPRRARPRSRGRTWPPRSWSTTRSSAARPTSTWSRPPTSSPSATGSTASCTPPSRSTGPPATR